MNGRLITIQIIAMKIIHIVFVSVLLFVVSCSNETTGKTDTTASEPVVKKDIAADNSAPGFTFDEYKGFPPEIDGCSCYFSANDAKLEEQYFFFTSNPDGLAIVRINNKQLTLKQIALPRYQEPANTSETIEVYEGDVYTVTVHTTHKEKSGDEVWTHKGTITVERKDGKKIVKEFTGECGC